jgi:glycosyltransferase involved in cell wall biosynthesis
MNILFISHLYDSIASGMNWSVPASVDAQSKIDNVMWVEMSDAKMEHWTKVDAYHNYKEFPGKGLNRFPVPFNHPDVVIFEGFYFLSDVLFSLELRRNKIPYIIIPRCSFTYDAIHNQSYLKKRIANTLFFNNFVKHASSIQFLTKNESETSIGNFDINNFFVIPNGVNIPKSKKCIFNKSSIKASFIGRLDIVHKGLDLLLYAISDIAEELKQNNFTLDIFGPESFDYKTLQKIIEDNNLGGIVSLKGEVSGEKKEKVLLDTDIFIMTSRFEGHPMGLIEALAYGIPCLITRGTNMKDEVESCSAGWTCENDLSSIKEALLRVIAEKDTLSDRGLNARNLSRNYEWQKFATDLHYELQNMVDNHK